jgi:hypothetical protein
MPPKRRIENPRNNNQGLRRQRNFNRRDNDFDNFPQEQYDPRQDWEELEEEEEEDEPMQQQRQQQRQQQAQRQRDNLIVHGIFQYPNGRLIRARTWIIIRYGRNPPDRFMIGQTAGNHATLDYMCGKVELGEHPTGNGRNHGYHWQGYMEFSSEVTAREIMELFGWANGSVWMRPRNGSQRDAIVYTEKEDTALAEDDEQQDEGWFEAGHKHPPDAAQGMNNLMRRVAQGDDFDEIVRDPDYFAMAVRHHAGIKAACQARENLDEAADLPRDVKVVCYYGDPRSGKSGSVYRRWGHSRRTIYKKGRTSAQGYTGYTKQPVLLLEEFGQADNTMSPAEVQEALDPYPLDLNVKYGQKKALWKFVFICTNIPPENWYPRADPAVRRSILERIGEIWRFTQTSCVLEKGPGDFPPIPDPNLINVPSIIRNAATAAIAEHKPQQQTPVQEPVVDNRKQSEQENIFEQLRKILETNPQHLPLLKQLIDV